MLFIYPILSIFYLLQTSVLVTYIWLWTFHSSVLSNHHLLHLCSPLSYSPLTLPFSDLLFFLHFEQNQKPLFTNKKVKKRNKTILLLDYSAISISPSPFFSSYPSLTLLPLLSPSLPLYLFLSLHPFSLTPPHHPPPHSLTLTPNSCLHYLLHLLLHHPCIPLNLSNLPKILPQILCVLHPYFSDLLLQLLILCHQLLQCHVHHHHPPITKLLQLNLFFLHFFIFISLPFLSALYFFPFSLLVFFQPQTLHTLHLLAHQSQNAMDEDISHIFEVMSNTWAEFTHKAYSSGLLAWHVHCDRRQVPKHQ